MFQWRNTKEDGKQRCHAFHRGIEINAEKIGRFSRFWIANLAYCWGDGEEVVRRQRQEIEVMLKEFVWMVWLLVMWWKYVTVLKHPQAFPQGSSDTFPQLKMIIDAWRGYFPIFSECNIFWHLVEGDEVPEDEIQEESQFQFKLHKKLMFQQSSQLSLTAKLPLQTIEWMQCSCFEYFEAWTWKLFFQRIQKSLKHRLSNKRDDKQKTRFERPPAPSQHLFSNMQGHKTSKNILFDPQIQ
jgi:hypothetical protein